MFGVISIFLHKKYVITRRDGFYEGVTMYLFVEK